MTIAVDTELTCWTPDLQVDLVLNGHNLDVHLPRHDDVRGQRSLRRVGDEDAASSPVALCPQPCLVAELPRLCPVDKHASSHAITAPCCFTDAGNVATEKRGIFDFFDFLNIWEHCRQATIITCGCVSSLWFVNAPLFHLTPVSTNVTTCYNIWRLFLRLR